MGGENLALDPSVAGRLQIPPSPRVRNSNQWCSNMFQEGQIERTDIIELFNCYYKNSTCLKLSIVVMPAACPAHRISNIFTFLSIFYHTIGGQKNFVKMK